MGQSFLIFDWDGGNSAHIAQHGITREETEQAIFGSPLDIELQIAESADAEERLLQIGETDKGRVLQLLTTWRGGKVRVISAWDAPKQLKSHYLAEMRRHYGDTEDSEV
ncbi:MAG: BrnT family toxin [Terracidiphilus sp.]